MQTGLVDQSAQLCKTARRPVLPAQGACDTGIAHDQSEVFLLWNVVCQLNTYHNDKKEDRV